MSLQWPTCLPHQNSCSSDPCSHNETCLNGSTSKGYLCEGKVGYAEENGEKSKETELRSINTIAFLQVVLPRSAHKQLSEA